MTEQKIFPEQIQPSETSGQVLVSDGSTTKWASGSYTGSRGYDGSVGYTGSASTVRGYTGSIGYTGSAVIGLTTNATDTVTLSSGFDFIPATDADQDLGSSSKRFKTLYLSGATIDLGGTKISAGADSTVSFKDPAGEPAPLATSYITFGNTANNVTMQIDPNTNTVVVSSPTGTTAAGYSGSNGVDGYTGSQGEKGDTGYIGSQGDIGYTGYTGSQGEGYVGSQGDTGYVGSQGDIGYTGSQGDIGYTGSYGDIGFTGSKGNDGSFGGAAFNYRYSNAVADTNPGNGYISFNNTLLSNATVLKIDYEDLNNTSIYEFLKTIDDSTSQIKGHFTVSNKAQPVNYVLFAIIGLHYDHADHFDVPVNYLSGIGSITDQTEVIITFARTGDVGDRGPTGYTGSASTIIGYTGSIGIGYTGSQGDIGYTGSQGDIGYTGSQGDIGYTGSYGDIGFTGSQGDIGYTGSYGDIGFTGSQGDIGYTGSYGDLGFTGSSGFTGSQGDFGFTGSQGDIGFIGSQGDIGFTGSYGDFGFTGSQGDIGFTGSYGDIGYSGSQGDIGYTGSQGDIGYTGSSTVLTVSLINTDNSYSNIVSNVSALRFDTDAGFDVTDLSNGEVKIGMNSTFKYWDVDGQQTLIAEGIDRIQLIAGENITLTTKGYVGSTKALTISATISAGYTGSASTVPGYTGSTGSKGDAGLLYWSSSNW